MAGVVGQPLQGYARRTLVGGRPRATTPVDEAVRPCLRCEALVEESRAYCPKCGQPMILGARLVVGRPAAVPGRIEDVFAAQWFRATLVACALLAAIAVAAAAWASLA